MSVKFLAACHVCLVLHMYFTFRHVMLMFCCLCQKKVVKEMRMHFASKKYTHVHKKKYFAEIILLLDNALNNLIVLQVSSGLL